MKPIRVLVADDSATVRDTIATLLARDPRISVVGQASDGLDAVAKARSLRPDVITMDALMPGLDGIAAIERILEEAPARILVVSAATDASSDLSIRALAAGALEIVPKPRGGGAEGVRAWGERLALAIQLMSEVPVVTRRRRTGDTPDAGVAPAPRVEAIGIVASTGGPPVLAQALAILPREVSAPILVAQHIAEGFTAGLVRWLASVATRPVLVATEGAPVARGAVYLPPDGRDLAVRGGQLATPRSAGGHCPSGDVLLASLAAEYGSRAAGVVLTGMGEDGARGLFSIRAAHGRTFAQDEATSVVFGMPRAARDAGAVERLGPIEAIVEELARLARR